MTEMRPEFRKNQRCPFCGSDELRIKPVWKSYWFIACLKCKAAGPVAKEQDDAWETWNRRSCR